MSNKLAKLVLSVLLSLLLSFVAGRKIGDDFLPSKGRVKILVLLIEFPDQPHKASIEEVRKLIFSPSFKKSARRYFEEVSAGKFIIEGEVYGWFCASHPQAYYANNSFGQNAFSFPKKAQAEIQPAPKNLLNSVNFN